MIRAPLSGVPVIGAKKVVPEEGIEPSWTRSPGDFESPASTNFTTPALRWHNAGICTHILDGAARLRKMNRWGSSSMSSGKGVIRSVFPLDSCNHFVILSRRGVVAQLGEHLSGRQEVTGSIPVNSTIFFSHFQKTLDSRQITSALSVVNEITALSLEKDDNGRVTICLHF